jgi:hypothetical protein
MTYDDLIKISEEIDAKVLKRHRKMFSVFGADFDNDDKIILSKEFKDRINIPYELRERITIDKHGLLDVDTYVVLSGDKPKPVIQSWSGLSYKILTDRKYILNIEA